MYRLKQLYILTLIAFFCTIISTKKLSATDTLKVGLYENEPKIYIDQNGEPAGIFVDLLNQISKEEGWSIKYIQTNWDNSLILLKQGEIDIMPDVAFSMNRNQLFDFNTVPVIESWSQIYAAPESSAVRLSDLKEKRIAVLKGSIQENELQALMKGFGYPYTNIPATSYHHAFKLVQTDSADAVVCNHFFGDTHYQQYGLIKTPVIFNPAILHFATAKGKNIHILHAIDNYLTTWQKTPNSFYYKTLRFYLEKPIIQTYSYPWWILMAIAGLFLLAIVIIVVLRKIVRQKTKDIQKTNQKLEEEKNKFQSYFEYAPLGIFVMNKDGVLNEFNSKILAITDYTSDELTQKNIIDIIAPESQENCKHCIKIIDKERVSSGMFYIITKTGEKKYCSIDSVKISEYKIVGFIHDVTQLKLAEDALRKSEDRYRSIINNSLDAILLTAPERKNYSANKSACELFGMSEEEICNAGHEGIIDLNDPNLPKMLEERKRTGKTKGELTFIRKDKTKFIAEVSTSVFYNSKGEELTSMFIRDITDRKKAEKELQKLKKNLEKQVEEKTKELSERVKELEHFRDVTIERELRMEELRKEIEQLKLNLSKK